jgi:hypothetical protein
LCPVSRSPSSQAKQPGQAAERVIGVTGDPGDGQHAGQVLETARQLSNEAALRTCREQTSIT